jgi:hypothetical protein
LPAATNVVRENELSDATIWYRSCLDFIQRTQRRSRNDLSRQFQTP